MNKYEKALISVSAIFVDVIIKDDIYDLNYSTEHLYNTKSYDNNKHHFDTLQELVDRTIPMKPHITFRYTSTVFGEMNEVKEERCPNCYALLHTVRNWSCVNYNCRQVIDWEKGETK